MGKRRATRHIGAYESVDTVQLIGTKQVVHRRCTTCGNTKPIHDFGRNGLDKAGEPSHRKDCKVCYSAKRKENNNSNKHAQFLGHQRTRGEVNIRYTFTEWRETVIFFNGCCSFCGRTMRKGETLTKDHLVPVSEGGLTTQGNVVPACKSCNSSKNNSEWREWLMKQPTFSQERMNRIFLWRTIIAAAGGGHDE